MQPENPYNPPYVPPAQGGQPPYAQPAQGGQPVQGGQPPYAQPAQGGQPVQGGQPPYAQPPYAQPAPYLATTDAARAAKEQKGKRDIGFGIVWIVAGLLITGVTMASDSPIYVVAWGPIVWGIYQIVRGAIAVSRNRQ
jgi:hypothetical protein